jgi:membrane protein implicated in regulation of membrane protease activity
MIAAFNWWADALYTWLQVTTLMGVLLAMIVIGYKRGERRQEQRQRRLASRLKGEIAKDEARNRLSNGRYIPNYELLRDGEGRMIGVVEVPRGHS